jgi:hypothetical protein
VGLAIELTDFTPEQILQLVQNQSSVNKKNSHDSLQSVKPLIDLIGGHPYLLQQALDFLQSEPDASLETLIKVAPTEAGPYAQHLRDLLDHLQKNEEIAAAMKDVLQAKSPIRIKSGLGFMLHSLGLVRFSGNEVDITCPLYRLYFNDLIEEF